MRCAAAWLSAGMLAVCVLATEARVAPAARTHKVTIANMQFEPKALIVRPGDTIEWINDDLVPHTATSGNSEFDSGIIEPGTSWSWEAHGTGTIPYLCNLHPTMTAQIEVK